MRCRACDRPLEPRAFPGGVVQCACGVDNETSDPLAVPTAHLPYREGEPRAAERPPPPPARSHAIGPLCPRCTRLLRDDPERAALACDACHGLFVDHAILGARVDAERSVDLAGLSTPPSVVSWRENEVRYGWCPHCGQVMSRMVFGQRSGIVVDVCYEHGTWFDAGELDASLEFIRGGGLEPDLSTAAPPAIDRVPEAELTLAVLTETQRGVRHAKDLAHVLLGSAHVWRTFHR